MSIKWNRKGFEEILCSPGAEEVCRQHGLRIQSSANARNRFGGEGFGIETKTTYKYRSKRAECKVYALDDKARQAETEDKALSGAI